VKLLASFPVLVFAVLPACAAARGTARGPEGGPAVRTGEPTEAECRELARKIEEAARSGDPARFDPLIDLDGLLDKAREGLEVSPAADASFRKRARESHGIGRGVCAAVKRGASYRLLRLLPAGGEVRLLFRLVNGDRGVNYHDLRVRRMGDGEVRIGDGLIYAMGENLSDMYRRFLLETAGAEKPVLDRLNAPQSEFVKNLPAIRRIHLLQVQGKLREAYDAFRELPSGLRGEKHMLIFLITIAQPLGEAEYEEALDRFLKAFPGDPAGDLPSIDFLVLKKKYDEALGAVDRIERAVGDDPYLECVRGNIHRLRGDAARAKRCARRSIDREPDLAAPYWILLAVSLAEKDFAETARILGKLEGELGVEVKDPKDAPEYAEFVLSEEYGKWIRSRPPKRTGGKAEKDPESP